MKRSLSLVTLGVLVTLLTATTAWAQATAQMSGTVSDDTGGVLPGVTVTATQTDQEVTRVTVTDGTGTYVLTNLPTGPYQIEVGLQGFQTYIQTGIVLQVGDSASINVSLGLSTLEETITVEAAAPLVDVQSAGIGEVVSQETIVSLPLQGRNVTDLLVLAGAAVQTGTAGARQMAGGVNISVAGGLSTGVAYSLDGAKSQQPARQPEPAAAVPGRAAGVPGGHRRPGGRAGDALGRVGQRGHQVGHEPVLRECLRVSPRRPVQLT